MLMCWWWVVLLVVQLSCLAQSSSAPQGMKLYSLSVNGLGQVLEIGAGDEPIVEAYWFCRRHQLPQVSCDQIMDHLCKETKLLCRSKRTVLVGEPKQIGFAAAEWTSEDSRKVCALKVGILQADAEKSFELGLEEDEQLVQGKGDHDKHYAFLKSLVRFHCTNMVTFRPDCYCTNDVKKALMGGLMDELDLFRWSSRSTLYGKLGVKRDATLPEIKRAYRKLSFQYHPDRHTGEQQKLANERVVALNEAYETLSDRDARFLYDQKVFGKRYVSESQLPEFQTQVHQVFGKGFAVSVDQYGNLKIVL